MVFPSHGYRGATLPVAHLASGDLTSLHSLSYLWVSRRRRRYFWRSRLPPQSFLPVGIGKATPLMPYNGDASSVLYWRRLPRLILATPPASYTGDAFSVLYWRRLQRLGDAWCDQPVDFDFDSGRRLEVTESLRSRPRHPRGISRMADGMCPHLT